MDKNKIIFMALKGLSFACIAGLFYTLFCLKGV